MRGLPSSLSQLFTGLYAPGYKRKAIKVKINRMAIAAKPAIELKGHFVFRILINWARSQKDAQTNGC